MQQTLTRSAFVKGALAAAGAAGVGIVGSALATENTASASANRICQLFGIEKPVVQAMMCSLTSPELAAAVSNAGGLGVLALPTEDDIIATKELTDKPFAVANYNFDDASCEMLKSHGVNIAYLAQFGAATYENGYSIDDMLDYVRILKANGLTAFVKDLNPTIDNALALQDAGADAIVIVGHGCGGCGPNLDVPITTHLANFQGKLDIPILAAGGIVNAQTASAVAALGAEGAFVGTRFLVCTESPCSPGAKEVIINSRAQDLIVMPIDPLRIRVTRTPLSERIVQEYQQGVDADTLFEEAGIAVDLWNSIRDGNFDEYAVGMSCAVDMITSELSAQEIVDDIASAWA